MYGSFTVRRGLLAAYVVSAPDLERATEHLGGNRAFSGKLDALRRGIGNIKEIILERSRSVSKRKRNSVREHVGRKAENEARAATRNFVGKARLFELERARNCKQ